MGIISWLSNVFSTSEYYSFEPQKNVWYRYYSLRYNKGYGNGKFKIPELPKGIANDAFDLKPYTYLNGKKYPARFYVTDNFCIIITKEHRIAVPIGRCSFKYKVKCFSAYNGGTTDAYYMTVLVASRLVKKDFLRFKKFKIKEVKSYNQYGKIDCVKIGVIQGEEEIK